MFEGSYHLFIVLLFKFVFICTGLWRSYFWPNLWRPAARFDFRGLRRVNNDVTLTDTNFTSSAKLPGSHQTSGGACSRMFSFHRNCIIKFGLFVCFFMNVLFKINYNNSYSVNLHGSLYSAQSVWASRDGKGVMEKEGRKSGQIIPAHIQLR